MTTALDAWFAFVRPIRRGLATRTGTWIIFLVICLGPPSFFVFHLHKMAKKMGTPPHSLLFDGFCSYTTTLWLAVVLGVVALVLSGISCRHLGTTITKWILQIIRPLSLGAAVGLACVSFYFFLVEKTNSGTINYDSVMADGLAMYLGFCGMFMGLYGVFFEKIPILDIETLMDFMTDDLKDCKNRLLWAFPGLSFGSVTVAGSLYKDLHTELAKKIDAESCKATLLVLSKEEIEAFYVPYRQNAAKIVNEGKRTKYLERVDKAIADSLEMLRNADTTANGTGVAGRGNCQLEESPADFRHQTIVIDDAVYFLHSIGLPVKIGGRWIFTKETADGSPVDFIATRISNPALAKRIDEVIMAEHEAVKNARPAQPRQGSLTNGAKN